MQNGKRRPRGMSPKGDFEQSKTVATAIIEDSLRAERMKTEKLRATRLNALKSNEKQRGHQLQSR